MMLPHDWLTWRLSGRHVTDRGDASGTGWWSPIDETYRTDLLGEVAAELGLSPDVVVGPGTGDNMAAALGLALAPREVTVSLGTSGTAYAVAAEPTTDSSGAVAGFADAAGGFLPLVATLNATKVTDTVAHWLGVDVARLAAMALEVPSSSQLVLIPYFDGERTPNLPGAAGAFPGLRNDTTRSDLARAAFTGVVNGLLDGVDALRAAGVDMEGSLRLIGGGARSPAYHQITADLWGSPITVHDQAEPVATRACVQAAAVHAGTTPQDTASSWHLDAGTRIDPTPGVDNDELRAAFQDAAVASHAGRAPRRRRALRGADLVERKP